MGFLTRTELLDKCSGEAVEAEVGAPVNAAVKVVPMSGEGAAAVQRAIATQGEPAAFAVAIAYCLASEDGKRMFSASDIATLSAKPYPFLEALGSAVMQHCGLNVSVEEAEKN